jgi:hypothetical protein
MRRWNTTLTGILAAAGLALACHGSSDAQPKAPTRGAAEQPDVQAAASPEAVTGQTGDTAATAQAGGAAATAQSGSTAQNAPAQANSGNAAANGASRPGQVARTGKTQTAEIETSTAGTRTAETEKATDRSGTAAASREQAFPPIQGTIVMFGGDSGAAGSTAPNEEEMVAVSERQLAQLRAACGGGQTERSGSSAERGVGGSGAAGQGEGASSQTTAKERHRISRAELEQLQKLCDSGSRRR